MKLNLEGLSRAELLKIQWQIEDAVKADKEKDRVTVYLIISSGYKYFLSYENAVMEMNRVIKDLNGELLEEGITIKSTRMHKDNLKDCEDFFNPSQRELL